MCQSTERRAPRPRGSRAAALSKKLSWAWSLPSQRNYIAVERHVQVTRYSVQNPSALVISQTTGKEAAHA